MQLEVTESVLGGGIGSVALLTLVIMVGVIGPLLLWLIKRSRSPSLIPDESKENQLFLRIGYTLDRESEVFRQGFLRSLTAERATLVVADRGIRKGSQLNLDLGSLPSLDQSHSGKVKAKVTQLKSLGGTPESILLDVQFLHKERISREAHLAMSGFPPA